MNEKINKFNLENEGDFFRVQPGSKSSAQISPDSQNIDNPAESDEAPILLNISSTPIKNKLVELEKLRASKLTGNPIVDFFYKANDYVISLSKVSVEKKSVFFRLLSVMVNAGVPLVKALDTLAEQHKKDIKFGRVIYDLARKVESGKSLSDAMKMHSDVFEEAQIGMVKSGEASGQLVKILSEIALQLEKSALFKSKVRGALIYPAVILCVLAAVVFALMVFVIPKMKDFFGQMGQDLPSITKAVIGASDFLTDYWYILIGAIITAAAILNIWKKTDSGKYSWDLFVINIPVIGGLIKKSVLAQFARSFSNLIGAGLPLINAIKITANSLGNEVYKKKLLLAAKDVEQGISLAETLTDSSLMPTMLTDMIAVGEQTAQIETVMEKIADFYEEDVDNMIKGLLKAFEPAIMIVMGIVVGVIVAAIMLPIIQMSSGVEGM